MLTGNIRNISARSVFFCDFRVQLSSYNLTQLRLSCLERINKYRLLKSGFSPLKFLPGGFHLRVKPQLNNDVAHPAAAGTAHYGDRVPLLTTPCLDSQ